MTSPVSLYSSLLDPCPPEEGKTKSFKVGAALKQTEWEGEWERKDLERAESGRIEKKGKKSRNILEWTGQRI
jgi:hypothetical protein